MKKWDSPLIEELDLSYTMGGSDPQTSELTAVNDLLGGLKGNISKVTQQDINNKTWSEIANYIRTLNGVVNANKDLEDKLSQLSVQWTGLNRS